VDDFLWLDQIQFSDRPLVGEKAFYLSHLAQRGYPVIPAFVVKATVLRQFLSTIQWLDPLFADLPNSSLHLDVDNARQLQMVAQHIRQEIIAAALPQEWVTQLGSIAASLSASALILRPSLTLPPATGLDGGTNFSGLLESHVCTLSPQAIAAAVKRTWAELFRARSLLYWQRMGVQLQKINLAILIQPLQNSLVSGWLQTGNSALMKTDRNIGSKELSTRSSIWEIQATWGLEMSLHKGEVQPDYYQVQPQSSAILTQKVGMKTVAYRLVETLESQVTEGEIEFERTNLYSPLQVYFVSEEQQKQYALSAKYLQELINLGQNLTTEFSSALSLEWVLLAREIATSSANLYITQIETYEHRIGGFLEQGSIFLGNRSGEEKEQKNISLLSPTLSALPATDSKTKIFKGLGAAVGKVVAKAQVITDPCQDSANFLPGNILVVKSLSPDWLPLIKKAAGIVAQQGGMTCHAAIIARELGIPAVVGVANATETIQNDQLLLVDGDRGEIHLGDESELKLQEWQQRDRELTAKLGDLGRFQLPNHQSTMATQLMVNLSQPSTIERAAALPVDGVGLLRSELMLLEILAGQHPNLWLSQGRRDELVQLLTETICQFAGAFASRPVFYRSLDWRSHEFQTLFTSPAKEANPMLGLRGTFSYLQDSTLFDLELEVLQRVFQSGYTNVNLILPFVRTVEEFSFCRRRIEQADLFSVSQFQLWIMAEVPSVLFLLPDYVKAGCMGISIGTNDLTQLLLGVDRDCSEMAAAFNECHPAVMQAISQLIQMAKQSGIPCSICGQAPAQHPELIDKLVRWGIGSISVSLDAVEHTYKAIVRAEQRLILEAARQQLNKAEP